MIVQSEIMQHKQVYCCTIYSNKCHKTGNSWQWQGHMEPHFRGLRLRLALDCEASASVTCSSKLPAWALWLSNFKHRSKKPCCTLLQCAMLGVSRQHSVNEPHVKENSAWWYQLDLFLLCSTHITPTHLGVFLLGPLMWFVKALHDSPRKVTASGCALRHRNEGSGGKKHERRVSLRHSLAA